MFKAFCHLEIIVLGYKLLNYLQHVALALVKVTYGSAAMSYELNTPLNTLFKKKSIFP